MRGAVFICRMRSRAKRKPTKKLPPMHPGEILREEYLVPLNISPGRLAKACGIPRTRVERIASETTRITADTALRLAKALNTSPQLWMNLQNDYDVQIASRELADELAKVDRIIPSRAA